MSRRLWSTATKNTLATSTMATTRPLVISVSRREGQVTFEAWGRTSCRNVKGLTIVFWGKRRFEGVLPARAALVQFRDRNGVLPKQSRRGTGWSRATRSDVADGGSGGKRCQG